jgi:hypothetical protein
MNRIYEVAELFIDYVGYAAHSKTYPSRFNIKFYVRTHVSPSSTFETEKLLSQNYYYYYYY